MAFKNNLLKLRESAGYKNAKEFAKSIGIPYTTYMGYENKNAWPPEETLKKIAHALHVSVDTLLDYRVDERSPLERSLTIAKMMGVKAVVRVRGKVDIDSIGNAKSNARVPADDFIRLVYAAYNRTSEDMEQWIRRKFCENLGVMGDTLIQSRLKAKYGYDDFSYHYPYINYDSVPDADEYTGWLTYLAQKPTATIFVGDVDKSELVKSLRKHTGYKGGKE